MVSKKNMRRWRKERYAASWSTKRLSLCKVNIINPRVYAARVADCVPLKPGRSVLFESSLIRRHAPCTYKNHICELCKDSLIDPDRYGVSMCVI